MRKMIGPLGRNEAGSTIVEFALLVPVVFGLIFGVIQVGTSMQSYNAMRAISADTARYATIQYMNKNIKTAAELEAYAEDLSNDPPYLLRGTSFDAMVTDVATPRVTGTFEKTIVVTYTPPSYMPIMPIPNPQLRYTRPIFVINE